MRIMEHHWHQYQPVPIGVGVFVLLVDGTSGILLRYLGCQDSNHQQQKGPTLCDGIPVLATIASVLLL
ncbi:MAG: hypothetical protein CM15mV22_2280 [Eurybiavirus sp.]|nr:MAG: hypothetical protein CM15mV22_2280 [Eurybiavirus sp.]